MNEHAVANGSKSILSDIHFRLNEFPAATQRVAKYILENPHSVVRQSGAEISLYSQSGQASIFRLCNSLGFSGLKELKIALVSELARSSGVTQQEESELKNRISSVALQQKDEITASALAVDEATLLRLASTIIRSRRIFLYGAGVSGIAAELLEYRLLRLGWNAKAFRDSVLAHEVLRQLGSNDTVIAISDSGVTAETVRFAHHAAKAGASVAAITCRADSELAKSADIVLTTFSAGPPVSAGSVSILARVAFIVECIAMSIESLSAS